MYSKPAIWKGMFALYLHVNRKSDDADESYSLPSTDSRRAVVSFW